MAEFNEDFKVGDIIWDNDYMAMRAKRENGKSYGFSSSNLIKNNNITGKGIKFVKDLTPIEFAKNLCSCYEFKVVSRGKIVKKIRKIKLTSI